jgi:CHAT domain-containing protein
MTHLLWRAPLLILLFGGCRDRPAIPGITLAAARAPPSGSADSLLASGEARYWKSEFDSAGTAFTAALRAARAGSDRPAEARALTWLGLAAWRSGRYADARRDGEAAIALKHRLGYREELARSYNALGLLAWNEGRLFDARALLDSAVAVARTMNDREGAGKAAGNLALVQVELGEFASARLGFQAMLESGRAKGDARVQGNALTNLAMLDVRVGNPSAAIPRLQEARHLFRSADYPTGEQAAVGQLATAYQGLGALQPAFAALDTALQLSRRYGLQREVAANLEVLAQLHQEVGENRRALGLYADAQTINAALGLQVEQGSDLRSQAEIYVDLGQGASAGRSARQALEVHRTAGATFEELDDLLLLAEIAGTEADTAAARQDLNSAHELASHLDARTARVDVALAEAREAERRGRPDRVLATLDAARRDLTAGGYGVDWKVYDLRAGAELALNRLQAAAAAARRAVDAVERGRAGLVSASERTGYLAGRARAYARLLDILVRLGRLDDAFGVADAMRGRALLEYLTESGRGDGSSAELRRLTEPDTLLQHIGALESALTTLERQRADSVGSAFGEARAQLERELTAARDVYEALAVRTPSGERSGLALLGAEPTHARVVQAALAGDEALLAYVVASDQAHLFVVRGDGIRHVALPVTAELLTARVRLARDLLGKPGTGAPPPMLDALHDLLVAPALRAGALRGVRRLVIVPHGALTYLPFGALRNAGTGRYLAQDFVVSVLPSGGALPALRGRSPGAFHGSSGVALAPTPIGLPASRAEVEAFRLAVPGATLEIGDSATEPAARRALETAAIVHLASHAAMNATNPLFSRIELASGSGGSTEDDGRLEVHELLDLAVQSPLVFLSGCETGVGDAWTTSYRAGEDYATLGLALLYAGAGSVVATLWRIDDRSAAALAARFYEHLRTMPTADALAQAQRDLLDDARFAGPYNWAGYELLGAPGATATGRD